MNIALLYTILKLLMTAQKRSQAKIDIATLVWLARYRKSPTPLVLAVPLNYLPPFRQQRPDKATAYSC